MSIWDKFFDKLFDFFCVEVSESTPSSETVSTTRIKTGRAIIAAILAVAIIIGLVYVIIPDTPKASASKKHIVRSDTLFTYNPLTGENEFLSSKDREALKRLNTGGTDGYTLNKKGAKPLPYAELLGRLLQSP